MKKIAFVLALGIAHLSAQAVQTTLYKVVDGKIVAYTVDVVNTPITTPAAATTVVTTPAATTTPVVTAPVVTAPVVTTPVVTTPVVPAAAWGTYKTPFAADSLWNSYPVSPVLGTALIPTSSYYPTVGGGIYSTGVFQAATTDAPMTVYGKTNAAGAWDPDSQTYHNVTIPHWPASVIPATGSDGHADIVDEAAGVIHSFWQLKLVSGKWTAAQYAWMPLAGRGWGDGAHYYQGARAVGIPASAGLIRAHEVADGKATYTHALAMSLTYNALSKSPTYTFPSTSADSDAATTNSGAIPEGSLIMLPASYVTTGITNLALRKVADTLKLYGAYVVDRNVGTPFVIYVENGAAFSLMPSGWDNAVAAELQRMRAAMRPVVSAASWVDGNGRSTLSANAVTTSKTLNSLSMRGAWTKSSGTAVGTFNTWTQSLEFPAATTRTVMVNGNSTGLGGVTWAARQGLTQLFTVRATGGAALRMVVQTGSGVVYDSGTLSDGQSGRFTWPAAGGWIVLYATSGLNVASSVSAQLVTVSP